MKNIVFSLILLLGFGRMAAQVTETTEGGDIQQTLNTLFQNVSMQQATTGIFMNKAIYFANIHNYDGTIISDSTEYAGLLFLCLVTRTLVRTTPSVNLDKKDDYTARRTFIVVNLIVLYVFSMTNSMSSQTIS